MLGHGPHVLRGMELYYGHLIVYSMGNFCTYGMFHLEAETGLTAVFNIRLAPDGTFLDGKLISGKQDGEGGPTPDPANKAIAVIQQLSQQDFGPTAPKITPEGTFKP